MRDSGFDPQGGGAHGVGAQVDLCDSMGSGSQAGSAGLRCCLKFMVAQHELDEMRQDIMGLDGVSTGFRYVQDLTGFRVRVKTASDSLI